MDRKSVAYHLGMMFHFQQAELWGDYNRHKDAVDGIIKRLGSDSILNLEMPFQVCKDSDLSDDRNLH